MPPDERYLLGNFAEPAGVRLEAISALFDPSTFRHVKRLGIRPGWRCWEVGAGSPTVPTWLADQVGPRGSVLATDIDLSRRRLVAADVVTPDVVRRARRPCQPGQVDVGGQHAAPRPHLVRQPGRHRGAARANLPAPPSRSDAEPLNVAERRGVEEDRDCLETDAGRLGGVAEQVSLIGRHLSMMPGGRRTGEPGADRCGLPASSPTQDAAAKGAQASTRVGQTVDCDYLADLDDHEEEHSCWPEAISLWRARRDSNPQPSDPQSDALSVELRAPKRVESSAVRCAGRIRRSTGRSHHWLGLAGLRRRRRRTSAATAEAPGFEPGMGINPNRISSAAP